MDEKREGVRDTDGWMDREKGKKVGTEWVEEGKDEGGSKGWMKRKGWMNGWILR